MPVAPMILLELLMVCRQHGLALVAQRERVVDLLQIGLRVGAIQADQRGEGAHCLAQRGEGAVIEERHGARGFGPGRRRRRGRWGGGTCAVGNCIHSVSCTCMGAGQPGRRGIGLTGQRRAPSVMIGLAGWAMIWASEATGGAAMGAGGGTSGDCAKGGGLAGGWATGGGAIGACITGGCAMGGFAMAGWAKGWAIAATGWGTATGAIGGGATGAAAGSWATGGGA
jgi:hypothetical protein